MDENITNLIITELKSLNKRDPIWVKDVESKIVKLIKTNPKEVEKKGPKIVWEIYEDLKIKQSIDKANFINNKSNTKNNYLGKGRKTRVNRKKALFDMTWVLKQNFHRLNHKELMHFVNNCEKEMILPEDFDLYQTAKIRDDFVFIMNGNLYFHILLDGKETKKGIKLLDNSAIILGKDYVCRINNNTNEIEDDNIKGLGLQPFDSIYFTKDGFVFVLKNK